MQTNMVVEKMDRRPFYHEEETKFQSFLTDNGPHDYCKGFS
jgi:hypothetical protein